MSFQKACKKGWWVIVVLVILAGYAASEVIWQVIDVSPSPGVTVVGTGAGPYSVTVPSTEETVTVIIEVTPPVGGAVPSSEPPIIFITVSDDGGRSLTLPYVEFFAPGGEFDKFVLDGRTLSVGENTVSLTAAGVNGADASPDFDPTAPYQIIFDVKVAGDVGGGGGGDLGGGSGGGGFAGPSSNLDFGLNLHDGSLDTVISPEPGSWALLALGVGMLTVIVWSRRTRA